MSSDLLQVGRSGKRAAEVELNDDEYDGVLVQLMEDTPGEGINQDGE